jgi:hypothetical protein
MTFKPQHHREHLYFVTATVLDWILPQSAGYDRYDRVRAPISQRSEPSSPTGRLRTQARMGGKRAQPEVAAFEPYCYVLGAPVSGAASPRIGRTHP